MSPPKVSIGIPVFNGEQYIGQALDALLAQSWRDFEIIISDNASTDRTEAICREYVARDARVVYHRLPENLGAINNFNRLVALSRGEYFKWAAADDICLPGYLEPLVQMLDEQPEVIWCHTQSGKIDCRGAILNRDDPEAEGCAHTSEAGLPRQDHDSRWAHRRFRGVLLGSSWCADCYGLIRRSALQRTGLYPACYGAEKVLLGELALQGEYRELPVTLFYQRMHGNSSASIPSGYGQHQYMLGTRGARRFTSTRLILLRAHGQVVRRAALSSGERLRCYWVIAQYLLQVRKWGHVIRSTLTGQPLKEPPKAPARRRLAGQLILSDSGPSNR